MQNLLHFEPNLLLRRLSKFLIENSRRLMAIRTDAESLLFTAFRNAYCNHTVLCERRASRVHHIIETPPKNLYTFRTSHFLHRFFCSSNPSVCLFAKRFQYIVSRPITLGSLRPSIHWRKSMKTESEIGSVWKVELTSVIRRSSCISSSVLPKSRCSISGSMYECFHHCIRVGHKNLEVPSFSRARLAQRP